ncbi:unnamed protein product [Arabis nemorensis]|uniref:Uncharacterized protein n=1 Tax=Arabis nemorensis TaxID=586526 RepID=A0A565CW94_9BRAS|nr:unnamed protein product [Arabis nemorensis]
MDKDEPFILDEVDYKTPKQSPQSNQTWPMDRIQQGRFQLKMSSLLSPVAPKRNYSISNAKSLLLQCLQDSKSDPLPRRRFRALCSDEGVLMDGVLVKSATGKKVSDSPSCSLGRSARSSVVRSQHKSTEFSSPRSENKENTRPQHSSGGKVKILANSPSTKPETPKAAKPSKLQATAEPFILTPKSSQMLASPVPLQHHGPHLQYGGPLPLTPPSYGHPYLPPGYAYPRPLHGPPVPYLQSPASPHGPGLYQTHYLGRFPRPTGYQLAHDLNQSASSSQTNTNTSEPPVHTPICTNPTTANLCTSTTTRGSRLNSPLSVDGHHTVTQNSSPSDGLEKRAKKPDLSSTSDGLETMAQKPDLTPFAGLGTMGTEKEWSPSDDGLPTFTQAQIDFMESHNRVLPDDVFEHYTYRQSLPVFIQLCLDGNLLPQTRAPVRKETPR